MNAFSHCKKTIIASLIVLGLPLAGQAATQSDMKNCGPRPISDFLDAQGTQSTFFPPVPDYVGWANGALDTFALVDYAGVADTYVQGQRGFGNWLPWTVVDGSLLECPLPNGSAEIRVHLSSDNAMGFAQSIEDLINNDFDFLNTPTIFGDKVQAVAGYWAFGSADLSTTFTISAPGVPLPDWYNVINAQEPNGKLTYGPVTLDIQSVTQGPLRDPRCLRVHQVASTSSDGKSLVFSTEVVEIDPDPCP
jgi:hypothetical protein